MPNLPKSKRTVLILDRELGFAFWLGQILDFSGYNAFPAKSCEDAAELLNHLKTPIDLLVLGSASARALAFADSLRRSHRQLKVLAAVGEGAEPSSIFSADAVQNKPSTAASVSSMDWLRTIDALLSTGRAPQVMHAGS